MENNQKTRNEIPEEYKWKINDLFVSDDFWKTSYDEVTKSIGSINKFKNELSIGDNLFNCLKTRDCIDEKINRIYVYAKMKLDEDSTNTNYQNMEDKASQIVTQFYNAISFIEPEILKIDENDLKGIIKNNDGLKLYSHYLEDLTRIRNHVLSHELEELLSNAREISQSPRNIFNMITNADMTFNKVLNEKGEEVSLSHGKYASLIRSPVQSVRKSVFKNYYESFIKQKHTFASTYSASVKKDVFFSKSRNYNSSLESALTIDNISKDVYTNLIEVIHSNLHLMHRYMELRKKALKLSELHMYDLYTPIVKDMKGFIDYDTAKKEVIESVKPLGNNYTEKVKEAFNKGWVDVYENIGKRSGAYSWGAFGTHPFILMNYENKIDDMFTLAHEMGHAMHSYNSWKTQPYLYSDYTIFLAEVASTVNEALLMEYLLKKSQNKDEKAYLINYFLEQFRLTVFRQTMFAEFEMITHNMVETGDVLTVETLCDLYSQLTTKYHGNNVIVDEEISMEWSRVPHFYKPFYVYQYATGFCSAMALSKKILSGEENSADSYINFLKSGSSDYSINILKKAGVDLTTKHPIEKGMSIFKDLLDKMENLI